MHVRSLWLMCAAAAVAGCADTPTEATALRMEAVSPTSLTGIVGEYVDPVPAVRVTNGDRRPVVGILVTFNQDGSGNLPYRTVTTGADGIASVERWALGTAPQDYTLFASATGVPHVVFTAAARRGPLRQLRHVTGDRQRGNTGQSLPDEPRVRALDLYANPLPNVAVTFEVVGGNGTVEFHQVTTNVAGIASAGVWTLGSAGGEHEVVARAQGYTVRFQSSACDAPCQAQQLIFADYRGFHRVNVGGVITSFLPASDVSQPAWSHDGTRLAFVKTDSGTRNTYLVNANGTGVRRIATGMHSPSWSPDNRTLVLANGHCVYDCGLVLVDADNPQQAPKPLASLSGSLPSWSPDGHKIAYISLSGDDDYHQLRTVNADGSGDTAISERDARWMPGASWSPDSRSIAFSWCQGMLCDIHIAGPDGAIRKLTNSGGAHGAAWSPDGSKIAFMAPDDDYFFSYVAFVNATTGGDLTYLSPGTGPAWVPRPNAARVRQ